MQYVLNKTFIFMFFWLFKLKEVMSCKSHLKHKTVENLFGLT